MGIRIGKIQSVNKETRQVRVYFEDLQMMSGWLKVLKNPPFIPAQGVEQKTESTSGCSGDSSFDSHYHSIQISPWLPSVNDIVLCIYNAEFNSDGYVLGAL